MVNSNGETSQSYMDFIPPKQDKIIYPTKDLLKIEDNKLFRVKIVKDDLKDKYLTLLLNGSESNNLKVTAPNLQMKGQVWFYSAETCSLHPLLDIDHLQTMIESKHGKFAEF